MQRRSPVYIIAEAGVNHNGDLDMALRLVEEAKAAGADCVKFQTFQAERIVTAASPKAAYQLEVTDRAESQFDMLKKLELDRDAFARIKAHCDQVGIAFMSTPYNPEDAELLNGLGVDAFKIASGQLVELPFLRQVARYGKQMIVSTGMADMAEVREAVDAMRATGNTDIVVLQCNTDYPSHLEDVNIRAMLAMRDELNVRVGYSDHVPNDLACFAAVALGAEMIEKHFTLDTTLPGPDHSSSLSPKAFAQLVQGIRGIEGCLGDGIKRPSEREQRNTYGMRRSLVAAADLKQGTVLRTEHFGFKRPANGLSPKHLDALIGKRLMRDLRVDEPFQWDLIEG
ncbi:MAG TPA: N-acetylneuraminate synthase [Flavobacteriales bacterium]|jgi:N-acetylneuraminate synthase/N,N'-diacetyllegionaminate synthase|nr:N-acetylneuraminate synthase [Flavobacteriales bacterium]